MKSESAQRRRKHKSKSKHQRKSRSKEKFERSQITRLEYSSEPYNVAGSSRGYFNGRPHSLTGTHDQYFSHEYELRPFYEFEDNDDERSYRPSRKSSASKRRSYDFIAGGPRTGLERELSVTRNWDHCSGSSSTNSISRRRPSIFVAVRKEDFSTILEEPTKEAAEQDAYCSTSLRYLFTAPKTLESSGSVENLSAAVATAWTDRTVLHASSPVTECSLLRASSVSSTLDKSAAETGSNASWGKEMAPEYDHRSLGTARENEQMTLWSSAFGRLRFLSDKIRPKLRINGGKISCKNIVSKFRMIGRKDDHEIPQQEMVHITTNEESPAPDVPRQGKETTGQERSRVPAFCKQFIGLESVVDRDRKCALLLAIGLLTAVVFLASAFFANPGFNVGLPPDQFRENAVDAEYEVKVDTNNVSGRPDVTSIVNRADTVTRRPSTSTRSTENESSFFSSKNYADNSTDIIPRVIELSSSVTTKGFPENPIVTEEIVTESSEDVSPSLVNDPVFSGDDNSADIVTRIIELSSSVTTNGIPENTIVTEEIVTESSEDVSPSLVNDPVFSGDDHLSYGGDTTNVDDGVF